MGDFNSPADDSGGPAHKDFLSAGFQDTWAQTHPDESGFTAMPSAAHVDMTRLDFGATQRIDYVMTRGGFGADDMQILIDLYRRS